MRHPCYLFEAGATSTTLVARDGKQIITRKLPPFNPNRETTEFETVLRKKRLFPKGSILFFYGAGLESQTNKAVVEALLTPLQPEKLTIYDDVLGAARAVFCNDRGIVALMGTGGLAAYYNGKEIEKRRGGYGYLIDDWGGGFELGRQFFVNWLNGDLPSSLDGQLLQKWGYTRETFVQKVYKNYDSQLFSSIVPFVAGLIELPEIEGFLHHYFCLFMERQVAPLCRQLNCFRISVVGSIGTAFEATIRRAAHSCAIEIDDTVPSPAIPLFHYHFQPTFH